MTEQNKISAYEALGGEHAVHALVERFYDLMDALPEAYVIRKLHPESLAGSRQKLFEFLSGWLGGPQTYIEKNGHPRLRARHMPFPIGTDERDAWLMCMFQAAQEVLPDIPAREKFLEAVAGLADHMRNRDG